MTDQKMLAMILISMAVTYALRAFPFVLLGKKGEMSPVISYLGKMLPLCGDGGTGGLLPERFKRRADTGSGLHDTGGSGGDSGSFVEKKYRSQHFRGNGMLYGSDPGVRVMSAHHFRKKWIRRSFSFRYGWYLMGRSSHVFLSTMLL